MPLQVMGDYDDRYGGEDSSREIQEIGFRIVEQFPKRVQDIYWACRIQNIVFIGKESFWILVGAKSPITSERG